MSPTLALFLIITLRYCYYFVMHKSSTPSPRVRAFVRFLLRHGRLVWLVALLLAIPAGIRTVSLYRHLKSDIEELLPRDAPSVRALDELRARTPGLQYLGVVVDTGSPENVPAAERFLDDLAARVRTYPKDMVREVRVGREEERAFVEKHAALYVSLADLAEVRRRIEARRDYDVAKATGSLMDEDAPAPSVDVSDIEDKYKNDADARDGDGRARFSSAEKHTTMMFIEASGFDTGAERARMLLNRVKADITLLGGAAKYAPGARVGYASDVAISVEETEALEADLSASSLLVLVAVSLVIVVYYRWWKSILVLMPPLLIGTLYAFALASSWPIGITELNSNTAFLGSIIIGNGINVGLVLLARYREERHAGLDVDDAIAIGVAGAAQGTLAAAAAAGVSYASLIVTDFRGFRQFGYIGGLGMIASWLTAFVLVPPLLRVLDRDPPKAVTRRYALMPLLLKPIERFPGIVVLAAVALTAVCAVQISRFDSSQLEHDMNKLRRRDTWESGAGYWSGRMDDLLGRYLTPTVILTVSREDGAVVESALRASLDAKDSDSVMHETVAKLRAIDDVYPKEQKEKLAEVELIRDALTPKIRSLIAPDRLEKLDKLLGNESREIALDDVPRVALTGLYERDGQIGRTVLVYPKPSSALWKAETIHAFVRELRASGAKAGGPIAVAGSIPLSSDILASISRDAPRASAVSFIGVVLVVVVVLRARKSALWVLGALVVGVCWLLGLSMAAGIKINFSNFIAYPITFGIGVDYAVNVMTRFQQDGGKNITGAVKSTGGAVALCSLTTILGYSSLLLAENRALHLFGLLAVLGEIACLSVAVIVLPAALLWLARRREREAEAAVPSAR
jgi:predicted RND superfamily exporter protein